MNTTLLQEAKSKLTNVEFLYDVEMCFASGYKAIKTLIFVLYLLIEQIYVWSVDLVKYLVKGFKENKIRLYFLCKDYTNSNNSGIRMQAAQFIKGYLQSEIELNEQHNREETKSPKVKFQMETSFQQESKFSS